MKRPTGNTRANGIGSPSPWCWPSARMIRTSCSRAEPAWLATISPSIASELARTPMMELCGSESKMSGVTMKTPISLGSRPDTRVSSRHTSSAIDAPAPPAIDDTTRTRGGSFGSNFPMPGTSAVDISEIVSTRNSASHAACRRLWISLALLSVIIRPMARYWPAPAEIGIATSSGLRGAQVPTVSNADSAPRRCDTAASRIA